MRFKEKGWECVNGLDHALVRDKWRSVTDAGFVKRSEFLVLLRTC
jgi:hypothetical protein